MIRVFRLTVVLGIVATIFGLTPVAKAAECYFFSGSVGYVCESEPESTGPDTFVTPQLPADTILGRIPYARQADNANIYTEPSRSAAPIRNVGDGFLFVTVHSWQKEADGATWYQINRGEYMHEDDIRLVDASPFQGVEIRRQPQRPFGWVVLDVQPSSEPDGEPNPAFAELPRFTFFQIYDAVVGEDDWIWYDLGNGRWVRQTYLSVVKVEPRPEGVGPDEFWTEVDLYEQTFAAYEGDRMVYASLISSGLNRWPTHEGLFQVWERFEEYKMSGAEGKVDYYFIEDVPYIMYFDEVNGIGLHGTYWHDRFGYKHSHGCVNMPILDAEWTFNWSADAPNDLWVWVHTSDPADHLAMVDGS
jgi:hypothetical protein